MNKLLSSKFILLEVCLTILASHLLWLLHKMSNDKKSWDLGFSFRGCEPWKPSSCRVKDKLHLCCFRSIMCMKWKDKVTHPERCWNMGNRSNPRATLIKAELCRAGLINKGPETPQMYVVQDQTQPALIHGWEALEAPFEAQPELCWHQPKCLQWTLIM